jgi:hypothetical protein
MAFTLITQGSFTSTGVNVKIPLPSSVDYFKTVNYTQMNATGSVCVAGEWFNGVSAANDGLRWRKAGSSAILIDLFSTSSASNGFTYVTSSPVVEAANASPITAISQASNAVVTQTNTYNNGDILQFYGTTGQAQIGGMNFQISSVSGSGYTLIGLNSSGFANAATAGSTRRVSSNLAVDPQFLYVTGISKASSAVVTCSVDPTPYYAVGMKIHFSIPSSFGMIEMNQLTGTITAVSSAAYTLTVNIDSTAFTTFAFPTSASSPTSALFATVAPAGSSTQQNATTGLYTGYNFDKAPFRTGQFTPFMVISGGAASPGGAANDKIIWQAYKMEALQNS